MARTLNVTYNPLSFEEINQPLMMQTQFHYAMLDQLDEQMEKGAVLNNLKYSDMDSAEYQDYLNYYNKVSELSKNIGERGAMASDKNLMRGLRQTYANDIVPMEQAYLRRAEEQKILREAQMKDPDLLVGNNPSMTGLKSYLDPNFTGLNQTLSGKDITNEVGVLTKQLANDIVSASNLGALEGTHGTLIKILKKKGYSNSDILKYANGDKSGKSAEIFDNVVNYVLDSKNIKTWDAWNDENFRDRVYGYANKGLFSGIGDSDISIQQDPFAVAALKKKGSETTKQPKPVPMLDRLIEYKNGVMDEYGFKNYADLLSFLGTGTTGNMSTRSFWNSDGSSRSLEEYKKFAPKERKESGILAYTYNPNGRKLTLPDSEVDERDTSNYTKAQDLLQKIGAPKRDFDRWAESMQNAKKKAEGDKFKPYTNQELWGMYNSPNAMQFGVYNANEVINHVKNLEAEGKFSEKMITKLYELPLDTGGKKVIEDMLGSTLMAENGKSINITPVSKVGIDGVFETGKNDVAKTGDIFDDNGQLKEKFTAYFSTKQGNDGLYLNFGGRTYELGLNALSESARNIIMSTKADFNAYGEVLTNVQKAYQGNKKALDMCREFAKLIDAREGTDISTYDDNTMLSYVYGIADRAATNSYSTILDTFIEDISVRASGRNYRVGATETVKNED
jgi:hypothetical protein